MHFGVVGNGHAREFAHGGHGARRTAEGIGRVDLLGALAGNGHHGVARDGHEVHRGSLGVNAHEHGHVGAAGFIAFTGIGAQDKHVEGVAFVRGGGRRFKRFDELHVLLFVFEAHGGVERAHPNSQRHAYAHNARKQNGEHDKGDLHALVALLLDALQAV